MKELTIVFKPSLTTVRITSHGCLVLFLALKNKLLLYSLLTLFKTIIANISISLLSSTNYFIFRMFFLCFNMQFITIPYAPK